VRVAVLIWKSWFVILRVRVRKPADVFRGLPTVYRSRRMYSEDCRLYTEASGPYSETGRRIRNYSETSGPYSEAGRRIRNFGIPEINGPRKYDGGTWTSRQDPGVSDQRIPISGMWRQKFEVMFYIIGKKLQSIPKSESERIECWVLGFWEDKKILGLRKLGFLKLGFGKLGFLILGHILFGP
jgi:hypothetical protein